MSTITSARPIAAEDLPPADDPFYYGWRDVRRTRPDGTEYLEQIPLSRWDTLHPEEGDHIVESNLNGLIRWYLAGVFRTRLADVPNALVLSDVRVDWDHPDLEHHAPDVCAIFGVEEQPNDWPSFDVAEQGTRPKVIVEIVSPNVRKNDIEDKVAEYHLAEVPCYIIIDRERLGGAWMLKGYTWAPTGYLPMATDARGRLWLADVNVWLGVDGLRVVCYDGATDAEIGDYTEITRFLKQEKARADDEKARADAEQARAESEQARAESERARADTEQARANGEKARADAVSLARNVDAARLQELEAEVARLRAQTPPK
jgi:Putative restriction endonuclease